MFLFLNEKSLIDIHETMNQFIQICLTNHLKWYANIHSSVVEWDWNEKPGSIKNIVFRARNEKSLRLVSDLVVKGRLDYYDKDGVEDLIHTVKRCNHLKTIEFEYRTNKEIIQLGQIFLIWVL